jgi:hypothetical protein
MEGNPTRAGFSTQGFATRMVQKIMYTSNRCRGKQQMKPLSTVFGPLRQLKGFPPKYCLKRLFCFLQLPNDSRYVTGPAWGDKSRNTDSRTHPLICRTALIERLLKDWVQRWKQGPIHKRINPSSALGAFMFNSNIKPGEGRKDTGLSTLVRPMEKSNG